MEVNRLNLISFYLFLVGRDLLLTMVVLLIRFDLENNNGHPQNKFNNNGHPQNKLTPT